MCNREFLSNQSIVALGFFCHVQRNQRNERLCYQSISDFWNRQTHLDKLFYEGCFLIYQALYLKKYLLALIQCSVKIESKSVAALRGTVFFKTRGHLSRLAWPTQRDGLSCLASPRLALRCAAWPSKTNPDPCSRPVATPGCSHRYYNGIVHNAKCINIAFFSVRQAMFLYKNDCLRW